MYSPPRMSEGDRLSRGFTFVEVMIVVVLVGVLSAVAMGTWDKFNGKMRAADAAKELRGALLTARSDALTRKRQGGILIDFSARRYLRFVDSSGDATTSLNCRYEPGEVILQSWTPLSSKLVFHSQASSLSPDPGIRQCGVAATTAAASAQSGTYAVVFRPDGSSCASLLVKMGVQDIPSDTLRLSVQPATGLVAMGR